MAQEQRHLVEELITCVELASLPSWFPLRGDLYPFDYMVIIKSHRP